MSTNPLMKKEVKNELCDYFLNWIKNLLGDEIIIEKEIHGDEGVVYKIDAPKRNYFLKIKNNSTFSKEREKLEWLKGKLPIPEVVDFNEKDGTGAVLLTALEGKNLAVLCKEWPAEKVITKLAESIKKFHETNFDNWILDKTDKDKVLVHGDACLPNFIFNGDSFSGYIDLADSRIANPEVDLSAAVWSLQYNMGLGYGKMFLEKYGWNNATDEEAERLRLQYINYQKQCGYL